MVGFSTHARIVVFVIFVIFLLGLWALSLYLRKKKGATFTLLKQKQETNFKSMDEQLAAAKARREAQRSKQLAANRGQGNRPYIIYPLFFDFLTACNDFKGISETILKLRTIVVIRTLLVFCRSL